jgi:hypothetical protein
MKIPYHVAEKLSQLLTGNSIASSSAKHPLIDNLVLEGIIGKIFGP